MKNIRKLIKHELLKKRDNFKYKKEKNKIIFPFINKERD